MALASNTPPRSMPGGPTAALLTVAALASFLFDVAATSQLAAGLPRRVQHDQG
eukprot:CAMPEP_0183569492 /NCGR_PEP_ID=MMETSP0371-20130417/120354_1 /TAXON_ID=268820 /ORGANISM="Peridinium aciculiferum, Strain PAER-2" /LENGTH=52 /DNA_ID=CAMNT_0025779083 /DNA_START=1 /DNA_END=159 /DNA_ORIENTATION=+